MKSILLIILTVAVGLRTSVAQQSLFQSTSGDTSIFLDGRENGTVLFNFGASKATFGYLHEFSGRSWGFGGDLIGAAQGGVVSLVKNGVPQESLGGDLSFHKSVIFSNPPKASEVTKSGSFSCTFCSDWLTIQAGYQRSQLNTVPSLTTPIPLPQQHGFDAYTAQIAYDQLWKSVHSLLAGDYLLGVSLGVSRTNNTTTPTPLPTVQVSSQIVTATGPTQQQTVSQSTKTVYVGDYTKYIGAPVNADAIWYPMDLKGHIGFDLFERSNIGEAFRYVSPGVGIFVSTKDPARPTGGLTVGYQNHKAQVALVTGWSF